MKFIKVLFIIITLVCVTGNAQSTDYIIDEDLDMWINVSLNASETKTMYISNESGFSPTSETFPLYDDFNFDQGYTRYDGNPVLEHNSNSSIWDSGFVNDPSIVKYTNGTAYQDTNGSYYMYYTGSAASGTEPYNNDQIGLATSTDLTNWTKYNETGSYGLVFPLNESSGQWDSEDCQLGTVLVDTNETFHMFFNGNSNAATDDTTIGHAESEDGITWTNRTQIIDEGWGDATYVDIYSPMVLFDSDDSIWKAWYLFKDSRNSPAIQLKYAYSANSSPTSTWTVGNGNETVFAYTSNIWAGEVWKNATGYHMIYDDYSGNYRYANSTNETAWVDQKLIFSKGENGEWDSEHIHFISSVEKNGTWYHFYRGDANTSGILYCDIGIFLSDDMLPSGDVMEIDSDKWSEVLDGGTITFTSDYLIANSGPSTTNKSYITSHREFPYGYILEGRAEIKSSYTAYGEMGFNSTYLAANENLLSILDATTTNSNWYLYRKNNNTANSYQTSGNNNFNVFKIVRESDRVRYFVNDVLKDNLTDPTYIPGGMLGVHYGTRYGNGVGYNYLDWIRVRKYTENEPTVTVTNSGSYYIVNITNNEDFDLLDYTVRVTGTEIGIVEQDESWDIDFEPGEPVSSLISIGGKYLMGSNSDWTKGGELWGSVTSAVTAVVLVIPALIVFGYLFNRKYGGMFK